MTAGEIEQTVTAITDLGQAIAVTGTALAGIAFGLYHGLTKLARGQAETVVKPVAEKVLVLEVKVDTMWSALMRRAEANAVLSGMATMNSPLTFGDEQLAWMEPLGPELRAAFRAEWTALDDDDLCLAIERRFGARILQEVCIPYRLADLSCLLWACAVARSNPP